jgi:hypothetical protein
MTIRSTSDDHRMVTRSASDGDPVEESAIGGWATMAETAIDLDEG